MVNYSSKKKEEEEEDILNILDESPLLILLR